MCEVITGGSVGKGGERVVPSWRLGRLFCMWEEGGDGAAEEKGLSRDC